MNEFQPTSKRFKLSAKEAPKEELTPDCKLRANIIRLNSQIRSNTICKYVTKFLNETAGQVMQQILKQVGDNDTNNLMLTKSAKISISSLLHGLPKTLKLPVDGLISSLNGQASDRASALRQYLESMMRSQVGFLVKSDDVSMGGVYCVDFGAIVEHMRRDLIETYILDAFGEKSMRIYRTLERQSILDDKGVRTVIF